MRLLAVLHLIKIRYDRNHSQQCKSKIEFIDRQVRFVVAESAFTKNFQEGLGVIYLKKELENFQHKTEEQIVFFTSLFLTIIRLGDTGRF